MPCSELSTSSKPPSPNSFFSIMLEDQAVAVVARLDAVDLAVELVLELGDVGVSLQPGVGAVRRNRERVLRPVEVGATGSIVPLSR